MAEQLLFFPEEAPPSIDLDYQFTPRDVLLPLHKEFNFTLDPCASPECFSVQLVKRWYGERDNGLQQSWANERVFCNPPYSNIPDWMAKIRTELNAIVPAQLVVALLPAWPDRIWWHDYVEPYREGSKLVRNDPRRCTVRFYKGRITFGCPGNPLGIKRGNGTFPSALVVWKGASQWASNGKGTTRGRSASGAAPLSRTAT